MSLFSFFSKPAEPIALPTETDIHCHIIPGVDDGSPDVETSCRLVEKMASWGLKRIIATPHLTADVFENTPETLMPQYELLKGALNDAGINVDLQLSSENRIDDFFMDQLEAGNIRPLPGNYLLLENPWIQEAWNLDRQLFDFKVKGYRTILAHPERYPYYTGQRGYPRYAEIHRAGTLFQVNLLSLAGHYGKTEKAAAEYLLEHDMVDFLGTDLHNARHVETIDAYLRSRDARKHFDKLRGRISNDRI